MLSEELRCRDLRSQSHVTGHVAQGQARGQGDAALPSWLQATRDQQMCVTGQVLAKQDTRVQVGGDMSEPQEMREQVTRQCGDDPPAED